MKQKMVIKVCTPACEKRCRRSKAMELAARAKGVSSMAITGDQLEVVGEDVDLVCLVTCLRKKVGWTEILQVEEIKETKDEGKEDNNKPEKFEPAPLQWYCPYYRYPPPPMVIYDDEPAGSCTIL